MRIGEKWILGVMAGAVVVMGIVQGVRQTGDDQPGDMEIPYYSTASAEVERQATQLVREHDCRECHSLWGVSSIMQSVPAPRLDGIGSLRDEQWLYRYLSAEDPQSMLSSRLREKYQMPSYAHLPEQARRTLAQYLASLKVKDWYLEETKQARREALEGETLEGPTSEP